MLRFALLAASMLLVLGNGQEEAISIGKVTTFRNTATVLDFTKLVTPFREGSVVQLTKLPEHGTIKTRGKNRLISSDSLVKSSENNAFIYQSDPDFPSSGMLSAKDTIGFDIVTVDNTTSSLTLNITVRLRGLLTRDYTLYSVDSKRVRNLQLNVRDGSEKLTLANPLLANVRIDTLPTNGCKVLQYNGDEISENKTALTDVSLRVKIVPKPDMAADESCSFTYTALRRNGVPTPPRKVTLIQRAVAFEPRAYSTNTVYNAESDASRMVELVGSTRNPGTNLTFVLTKIPTIGALYDIAETSSDSLPDVGITDKSLPLTLYQGPKTRVVLTFKVNPSAVKQPTKVTLEYFVKDKFMSSKPATVTIVLTKRASPVCGDVVVRPVFWDKPVKEIVLNYTNPNMRRIQKLVLLKTPTKPIGDLFYDMTFFSGTQKKQLKVGDYFSDKNKRLSYMVRRDRMRESGNETFKFRAQGFDGLSCVGSITFVVLQHDAKTVPPGTNLRRELVRLDSLTLLPLWGTANKTLTKPTSAVVSKTPIYGSLHQVSSSAPYEKGRMYRVNRRGQARSYCTRHNCEEYLGDRIDEGTKIEKLTLTDDLGTLDSDTRFWVFYRAPKNLPLNVVDEFEYRFYNDKGEMSELQRVSISFRKRLKRIIVCRYKSTVRNQNFDHQQETYIKCVLSNTTNQAVMIPEFDKYRRHGAQVPFRMFQYRLDGNRVIAGERLKNTTNSGIVGQWLDSENTVVVVPAARARQQRFQFRAHIYNTSADTKELIKSTLEEVRVQVVRDNSVPEWNWEYITGRGSVEAGVGDLIDIDVSAYDADDDLLQFRLASGVTKGALYFDENRFGLKTMTLVKTGSVIRIPKGSVYRSDITMHYKTDGNPKWKVPFTDSFTLYADDGGGVLSDPLVFNITVTQDTTVRKSANTHMSVSYGTVVLALLCACAALILILAAVLRRRSRQRYMVVPQDVEMQK